MPGAVSTRALPSVARFFDAQLCGVARPDLLRDPRAAVGVLVVGLGVDDALERIRRIDRDAPAPPPPTSRSASALGTSAARTGTDEADVPLGTEAGAAVTRRPGHGRIGLHVLGDHQPARVSLGQLAR